MRRSARPARAFAAAAFAAAAFAAEAGSIQLAVTDREGKPAPNVAVLVHSALETAPKPAASPRVTAVIEQRDLRFEPFLSVVSRGSTVRFINRDPYDHHIKSMPGGMLGSVAPAKTFELRLDAYDGKRERSAEVLLDAAGIVGLGCHLHSSMRGHIVVADTPWFARTDAQGLAVVEGVPDGAVELKLWHPEQLVDQAAQTLQVGAARAVVAAQLNFTPRRRRGS